MCLIEIIDNTLILCFVGYSVITVGKSEKHPIDIPRCMRIYRNICTHALSSLNKEEVF